VASFCGFAKYRSLLLRGDLWCGNNRAGTPHRRAAAKVHPALGSKLDLTVVYALLRVPTKVLAVLSKRNSGAFQRLSSCDIDVQATHGKTRKDFQVLIAYWQKLSSRVPFTETKTGGFRSVGMIAILVG